MSESSRGSDVPSSRREPTLLNLIDNVRTGQLSVGPLKPNRWLEYSVAEKTDQERTIEGVMESCTFKAAMSCVVGNPQVFGRDQRAAYLAPAPNVLLQVLCRL